MKKILLFYIFLFIINISAQDLYFCKSVSDNGKPIDAKLTWSIEPYGTRISILYEGEEKLQDDIYYLFIDKKTDGVFKPYDSKTQRPTIDKTWMEFEFNFQEEGEYEIYVMNSDQKILATSHLTTTYSKNYNSQLPDEETSYSYYDSARITFCERVFSNKPYNSFHETSTSQNDGEVYIYLQTEKPLKTDVVLVYIYRKKNRAFEYDDFVTSKKFKVDPTWTNTYFKYQFTVPGEYKISIFNKNEKPIKNGFLRVQ